MHLKQADIVIMTISIGLIVANLYYCQPLVVLIARDFGIDTRIAARINYITMAGYACGLLFLVPLGDLVERKRQIFIVNVLVVLSLAAAAMAPTFGTLQLACFCVGFFTIIPQLILPMAAHHAPPERRGKVIGTVMSGLLVGILLSRTVSGYVGQALGWRAMLWIAAGISTMILIVVSTHFPRSYPAFKGTYGQLMRSLVSLLPMQALQEACVLNALTFGTFGAFWTTMVLYLSGGPFYLSSGQVGLFGLAGAAGALAAPIAGRRADKRNPRGMILLGILTIFAALVVFYFTGHTMAGMIAGVIAIDFGIQAAHISNQSRIYALMPEARNRVNTIYITATFIGTSAGSAYGLWLWGKGGWSGFCVGCMGLMVAALAIYGLYHKRLKSQQTTR